ncbi:AMP-binding protein [Crenobacter sp. SG2303]|uniref:AMP-binding protein n=1 Tax=Crenobacter oryzisoli TaxID=3056844 RepID=A0ABT7XUM0_9NEIS|nr:AMP-binding protein [Crenobacter sp. SG2303]MDN0077487.1 AMP-binding protein [Crenobacter sp. SG2303]
MPSEPPFATAEQVKRLLEVISQLRREMHPANPGSITLDSSFERELGFDSLARVELVQRVGTAFGIQLPDDALSRAETPRDLLQFLEQPAQPKAEIVVVPLGGSSTVAQPHDARTLTEALVWHVDNQPDRVHVLLYDEKQAVQPISYRELFEAGRMIAGGLIERGLEPGQTVALMLPTGFDYLTSFIGVMLAGCVPVPIYPPTRLSQLEEHLRRHARILSNAGTVLMITIAEAKSVAVMIRAAVDNLVMVLTPQELAGAPTNQCFPARASDLAFLQYTSGSTGDPKGVMLTHANLLANIRGMGRAINASPEDIAVSWLPLYHDMGLIGAWLGSLYHGFPLVLMSPLAFLAQPARWLQAISRHHATLSGGPNFAYELCAHKIHDRDLKDVDLSSWRFAFNGAEPVSPATVSSFTDRFAQYGFRRAALAPVYGLAESSVGLAFPPIGRGPRIDRIEKEPFATDGVAVVAATDHKNVLQIPSCGRPLPEHEIRVVGEDGKELPERQIGKLEFRGPSATHGYYRNAQATKTLFHDDWLDSGDNAYMADGEVYLTGRVKDLIIRGGRNFYPYDLEEAIGELANIRKGCVAVFASADPIHGTERLVVLAETRERSSAALDSLRQRISQTAIDIIGTPADDIVLAPAHSVLKTSSGKIRRQACRQAYERGELSGKGTEAHPLPLKLWRNTGLARIRIKYRQLTAWLYGIYAWLVLLVLALPAGGLTIALQRPALGRRIVRTAARAGVRMLKLPLAITGLEHLPTEPHVLLVNHASYLDVLLLTALLPASPGYTFTAKRELSAQPLLKALLTGLGTRFIERTDVQQSMESVDVMVYALRSGENLLVFPEGTFSREAGLKPFHLGAFIAASRAGVPVVVAALRGTRVALRDGTWLLRHTPIDFEVGLSKKPVSSGWSEVVSLSQETRRAMLLLCGEHDASP